MLASMQLYHDRLLAKDCVMVGEEHLLAALLQGRSFGSLPVRYDVR